MGNIFIKPEQMKCVENNNINKKHNINKKNDKFALKQINVEGDGDCHICKKINCKGYKIYSVEYNTNSFVCLNCYIGIL